MGVRIVVNRIFNLRDVLHDEKHPSARMKKSKEFFRANKTRIHKNIELLEDEESKDVFKKMIQFRCFSRYKNLPHNSISTMYFYNDFFKFKPGEVFIDCGAYDGDTIRKFKRRMKKVGSYKIIGFEPDEANYKELRHNHPDVIAIKAGVWREDGILEFGQNASNASTFLEADNMQKEEGEIVKVPVRSIDNIPECRNATFIKMDIEGSEYNAILGAQRVICKNNPKLAICIYHSDEDMLRLIELVHKLVPDYHLYIRQHSNSVCETVLYACIEK